MSFPFSRTLGAGTHQLATTDVNILVDTSAGVVNLILPKISEIINQISRQGYSVGSVGVFSLYITDISNNASVNNINITTSTGDYYSNNISNVIIDTNNGSVALKPISETYWNVLTSKNSSPFDLTTTGIGGASTLNGDVLNIPVYQNQITLTTNGTSGASTFNGTTLNIPVYTPSTNYGLFAQTANSVPITATTTEGTLIDGGVGTLSVPPNGFSIGDSFQATFGGYMSAKNNDSITIRIKSGSIILADSGALSLPAITNQVWNLTLMFTIRAIGTSGVASIVTLGEFHILKLASGTQQGFGFNSLNNTTFNTTIPNNLDVTVQWSSNSALNSIYSDIFVLNKIY
jgi:hypothetical protein